MQRHVHHQPRRRIGHAHRLSTHRHTMIRAETSRPPLPPPPRQTPLPHNTTTPADQSTAGHPAPAAALHAPTPPPPRREIPHPPRHQRHLPRMHQQNNRVTPPATATAMAASHQPPTAKTHSPHPTPPAQPHRAPASGADPAHCHNEAAFPRRYRTGARAAYAAIRLTQGNSQDVPSGWLRLGRQARTIAPRGRPPPQQAPPQQTPPALRPITTL